MRTRLIIVAVISSAVLMACKPQPDEAQIEDISVAPATALNQEETLNCKPAAGVFGFLASVGVYDAWADRPIEPLTTATFTPKDGKGLPEKFVYRFAGQDFAMPVEADGSVILEYSALDPDDGGELCVLDPAREGDAPGGLDLSINTEFVFKKNPAGYTIDTLEAGSKLTTEYTARIIMINTYADINPVLGNANWLNLRKPLDAGANWQIPKNVFMKGDQVVKPPKGVTESDYFQFALADAKAAGADRWVISGKNYVLSAVFDPNKVPENYKEILGVQ